LDDVQRRLSIVRVAREVMLSLDAADAADEWVLTQLRQGAVIPPAVHIRQTELAIESRKAQRAFTFMVSTMACDVGPVAAVPWWRRVLTAITSRRAS